MYYAEFCAPLKSRATVKYRLLYQSAIELLPIWIMFIDRIIDRICFLSVTLTTELLNLAQVEPCCRGVALTHSLLDGVKIRPSNGVHRVDALVLYGNAIYSI